MQPTPEPRIVPAAVDDVLRSLLAGPPAPARVVVATPAAVYATVRPLSPRGEDAPEIVALLTPGAVRIPGGVVPAQDAADLLARLRPGSVLAVGAGRIDLGVDPARPDRTGAGAGGVRLVPARWWDSTVGRVQVAAAASDPPRQGAALPRLPDAVRDRARALAEVLAQGGVPRHALEHAVGALVGLGPGLTPVGDDVLTGALVALGAVGASRQRDRLAAAVGPLLDRTTVVSAALLRHAAAGRAIPELARYVFVLAGTPADGAAVGAVGQDLLGVGASSGSALAHGARIGLRAAGVPVPSVLEAM